MTTSEIEAKQRQQKELQLELDRQVQEKKRQKVSQQPQHHDLLHCRALPYTLVDTRSCHWASGTNNTTARASCSCIRLELLREQRAVMPARNSTCC